MRLLPILLMLALGGCDDADSTPRQEQPDAAGADAQGPDALPGDATPDASPADAAPDARPADATPDARPADAAADAAPPDAAPDAAAAADAAPDARPPHPDAGPEPDGGTPADPDQVDPACMEPGWAPGACVAGVAEARDDFGGAHVADGTPIGYTEIPPASGPHRPRWARWGEYDFLPPQRWLHNLEHGGVAFLYHPCADAALIDALREHARARPADDGGEFRWVLTPYPELPTAIAVVAWRSVYTAECVRPEELGPFIDRVHRTAPEDVAADGGYAEGWIGR